MQRVNQAVGLVSPHLAPGDLQSDSPAARDHPGDAPHANVRRLYNEVFLPRMREHLQEGVHSGPSSGAPASQKADALKKVCTAFPPQAPCQQHNLCLCCTKCSRDSHSAALCFVGYGCMLCLYEAV